MDLSDEFIDKTRKHLVTSIRQYASANGFKKAVLGLSGGIDSAVTCCLAVEALGKENVLGVSLPGPHSSPGSKHDALELAKNLGIDFRIIPIEGLYDNYLMALAGEFNGAEPDVTEQNLQARIRANILMALSNKFNLLVLATGNKSELYTGYCTLYGDLTGGLAPIAGLYKGQVYALGRRYNLEKHVIPGEIFTKAPSAELAPGQKDQDSLPPYDVLDEILHLMLDNGFGTEQACGMGFDRETVTYVAALVAKSAFKRRQAPPGIDLEQPKI